MENIKLLTEIKENNNCIHGFKYICPICKLNRLNEGMIPVPLNFITHRRGKRFIYHDYWLELYNLIRDHTSYDLSLSYLSKFSDICRRSLRNWKHDRGTPKIFNNDECKFNSQNSYFIGLFLSDGHIRNNGAKFSYTYQVGSSNIFQGYWHPQLIQRFLPIFKHKKKISNTYIELDRCSKHHYFKTNLSSLSPIFAQLLLQHKIIKPKKCTKTTSFHKEIPFDFLNSLSCKEELFQGIFDGDGGVSVYTAPDISLALAPDTDYTHLIKILPLVPTLARDNNGNFSRYQETVKKGLYFVRFAPGSLNRLSKEYTAKHIVDQLDFFLDSAKNSIRPDKVYKLIKVIDKITSKGYGEYNHCLEVQREVRDLALKMDFKEKIDELKKQYPIKDGKYLPFIPKWAENLCTKEEAWEFFFNKENLIFKNYKGKIDFSEGVPINFELLPNS